MSEDHVLHLMPAPIEWRGHHVIPSKDAEEGTGRAAGMLMFALLDGQGGRGALEMTARSSSKSFALRYQTNA